MRRWLEVLVAGVLGLTLAAPNATAAATRPCLGRAGLVWENAADVAELFTMSCGGVVHQLTHTPPGQGGSELPRWGRDGKVYFDSDRAGNVHLYRMKAVEGAPTEQLTVTDGFEFAAAPTPDGRHIVFEHGSADGTEDGLFVMPNRPGVGEAMFRRLTSNPNASSGGIDSNPDVSPDGRTVAFIRVLDPTFGSARSAVFTIGLDGKDLRRLTPYDLNAITPRWSHDGRWLLFSSHGDSFSATVSADVYLVDRNGQHMRNLTHGPPGSHSFTPAWAPDGSNRFVCTHAEIGRPGTDIVLRSLNRPETTVLFHGTSGSDLNTDWD